MDEEALLKQFAAQFAHGPDDADDTDAAAAAQGADSTANQVADDADQSPATFDTQQFLNGLDAIFDRHTAATEAGPYLEQAMVDAENAGDEAGLLTVLNERWASIARKVGTRRISGLCSERWNWPLVWA